ncbi:MAG: aldo/keto reductase [Janthinobacterium lividum]
MPSETSPDPKAPDMPTMPESEADDMGPEGVQNESTGGYTVAHDADPNAPILQRPGTKSGLGTATPIAAAQAALPSALVPPPAPLAMTNTGPSQIPQKPLGTTGVHVSIIGIGGSSLGDASSLEEAVNITHEAIDAGVTFFDNAWEYNNHRSEDWMGRALQGHRDKITLMTKVCTHGRDKKVAMQQLEESLLRLRTDHLDVWQIHECVYYDDPDLHFVKNGVWEALLDAKKQGKVRFIGFTGHKTPQIHLRMLALADQHGLKFDTVQMPLNAFDATYRSFQQFVLPEANRRGMGVLGMKSLSGGGEPIQQGAVTAQEALRYAMSLPVATTISGIDSLQVLRQNLAVARDFKPMTSEEMTALAQRCQALAADGHLELYKSSKKYDANVGRSQHGYQSLKELPM